MYDVIRPHKRTQELRPFDITAFTETAFIFPNLPVSALISSGVASRTSDITLNSRSL